MPYSNPIHHEAVKAWLVENWPRRQQRIVDVGAGAGAYGDLLRGQYPNTIGIEVFSDYVVDFGLREKYRNVVMADVRDLGSEMYCDAVVIMGDVLGLWGFCCADVFDVGTAILKPAALWQIHQSRYHSLDHAQF